MRFGKGMGVKDHIIIHFLFARQKRKGAKNEEKRGGLWVKHIFETQTRTCEDACYVWKKTDTP